MVKKLNELLAKHRAMLKDKKGFTLIELIIVVVIIGILVAIGMMNSGSSISDTNKARIKSDFQIIATAENEYYGNHAGWVTGTISTSGQTDQNSSGCGMLKDYLTKCPVPPIEGASYTVTVDDTTNKVNVSLITDKKGYTGMSLESMK